MRRKRQLTALPQAFAAILLSIGLGSCSWLLNDGLPSWLSREVAQIDLSAKIASVTGSAMQYSPTIRAIDSAGRDLVQFQTLSGRSWLFVLDSAGLGFLRSFDDQLTPSVLRGGMWGVDAGGRLISGDSMGTVALDSALIPQALSLPAAANAFYCSEGTTNYRLSPVSGTGIDFAGYDGAWSTQTMATLSLPFSTVSTDSWTVLDFGMSPTGPRLLLEDQTTNACLVLGWPSMAAMVAGSSILEGAAQKTPEVPIPYQSLYPGLWLCADGIVVSSQNSDSGTIDLVHIGFDAAQATFTLDRSWGYTLSFGAASRYWFIYDEPKGRLMKERPWW
ncbi:MAG TPA: hypothetical protein VMV44_08940 [Rectinemataceae bacterium]|nr:hypothetical protein [Rectinemataceae bacterium]